MPRRRRPASSRAATAKAAARRGDAARGAWLLGATAVALALLPYATTGLEFRRGMVVQAAGLVTLLGLGALALTLERRAAVLPALPLPDPRHEPLVRGLVLYLGAAGLGTAVGLVRGNPLAQVAGQALSLALLPAGAFLASRLAPQARRRSLEVALPVALALATLLHLAFWWQAVREGRLLQRLVLPNSVAATGFCLAGLLLALSWARRPVRDARLALPCLALAGFFALGSGTRGLWLSLLPALGLYVLASGELAALGKRRWATIVGLGLLVAAGLVVLLAWIGLQRPNLLARLEQPEAAQAGPRPPRSVRWGTPGPPLGVGEAREVPDGGTYRLEIEGRGRGQGRGQVLVRGLAADGSVTASLGLWVRPTQRWERRELVAALPSGTATVRLEITGDGERGVWWLRMARLERLGPLWAQPLLTQLSYLHRRLASLAPGATQGNRRRDASLQFRLGESRQLLGLFAAGDLGEKLLGRGLGADFDLDRAGTSGGARRRAVPTNYIHNFYLFLLYKLGLVGGLAILAALGSFVVVPLRRAFAASGGERRLLAAVGAAWTGTVVLAVSSPEIINFRVAPLLGLLLAMALAEDSRATPG